MTAIREPVLKPVPLKELRPTQITVGFREVDERRKHLAGKQGKEKGGVPRDVYDSSRARSQESTLRHGCLSMDFRAGAAQHREVMLPGPGMT